MIIIKIKTENAAFEENRGQEIARILRDLEAQFAREGRPHGANDINGTRGGARLLLQKHHPARADGSGPPAARGGVAGQARLGKAHA